MLTLYKNDEQILRKLVYGLVGPKTGIEFMEFYKINENFENVLDMMTNEDAEIVLPSKSDRLYALCSAMNYLLWKSEDNDETSRRINGFLRICIELPVDFSTMTMFSAM